MKRGDDSATAIGGKGERTEQQWDVIVLLGRVDGEVDRDARVERRLLAGGEVVARREGDPVMAGLQGFGAEVGHPTVGIGARLRDGRARFALTVLQGNKSIGKVTEFDIMTKK